MRRLALLCCVAVSLAAVASGGATAGASSFAVGQSWAAPQIKTVVEAGLMGASVADFRANQRLTWDELDSTLALVGGTPSVVPDPSRPVTLRELDAQLVGAAGLRTSARQLRLEAASAGLTPRPWLGTETVARMLGFRVNHLKNEEQLELQLAQPATRAEAAYSVARLLALQESDVASVEAALESFDFPELSTWRQAVLRRALRFVGSPYVWAGTSEKPQKLFGQTLPGGFDCSGLVWRVFKLEPFAGAPELATVLKGRTTFDMSGEVPRSARIGRDALQPGDIAFFGSRGPASKPSEVGHMGIYVGNGWMVHSSDRGTTLTPMTGWYETRFAWGRSPLAEAGLEY